MGLCLGGRGVCSLGLEEDGRGKSGERERQTKRKEWRRQLIETGSAPMADRTGPNTRPCVYLSVLIELFIREQLPAEAVCSLLAMCWFWPGCVGEDKDIFLGSALLTLCRLLRDKLACLLQDMAACMACEKAAEASTLLVTLLIACVVWVIHCRAP